MAVLQDLNPCTRWLPAGKRNQGSKGCPGERLNAAGSKAFAVRFPVVFHVGGWSARPPTYRQSRTALV